MNTIELVPASRLSLGELTAVLNAGYADYFVPAHQTEAQVARSLRAWDIDLDGSTVACAGDSAVGIVLVGVRGSQGWIGSLAVVPAWRRHRVGRHLMVHVQALARTRGLATLDLEVLTRNAPALTLYLALGFSIQRELLVWQRPAEQGALPDPFMKLQPIDPAWAVDHSPSWHNTAPCWQRDAASLRQLAADVQAVGIMDDEGAPQAYCLFRGPEADQLRLLDVGAAPGANVRRAGRELLQGFHLRHLGKTATLVNEPVESSWNPVFAALGYYVVERQHEMRWMVA
jgi:ribosomal protein S18 acetylase RimI-like enzyme